MNQTRESLANDSWRACDILRRDNNCGGGMEYIEHLAWLYRPLAAPTAHPGQLSDPLQHHGLLSLLQKTAPGGADGTKATPPTSGNT